MIHEIWKSIPGFPAYEVSDYGRVRSYYKRESAFPTVWYISDAPQRILQPSSTNGKYFGVHITDADGNTAYRRIASLVLLAFIGPPTDGLEICHNDSNPQNDHLSNLRYDTRASNFLDLLRFNRGRKESLIVALRELYANGADIEELKQHSKYCAGTIYRICSGRRYQNWNGPITPGRRRVGNVVFTDALKEEVLSRLDRQTAASLARQYGISESTISRWRSGERRPTPAVP